MILKSFFIYFLNCLLNKNAFFLLKLFFLLFLVLKIAEVAAKHALKDSELPIIELLVLKAFEHSP